MKGERNFYIYFVKLLPKTVETLGHLDPWSRNFTLRTESKTPSYPRVEDTHVTRFNVLMGPVFLYSSNKKETYFS